MQVGSTVKMACVGMFNGKIGKVVSMNPYTVVVKFDGINHNQTIARGRLKEVKA